MPIIPQNNQISIQGPLLERPSPLTVNPGTIWHSVGTTVLSFLENDNGVRTWVDVGAGGGGAPSGPAGGVLGGTYPSPTFNDSTIPASQSLGITDAVNNAVTDVLGFRHLLSAGSAAAGMGIGHPYILPNAGGTLATQARIAVEWEDPAVLAETSRVTWSLRSAGAALSTAMRLRANGLVEIGAIGSASTSPGVRVANGSGFLIDDLGGTARVMVSVNGSSVGFLGSDAIATRLRGDPVSVWPGAGAGTQRVTFHSSGGVSIETTVDPGAGILLLANARAIAWRNAANSGTISGITLTASDAISISQAGIPVLINGQTTIFDTTFVIGGLFATISDASTGAAVTALTLQHDISGAGTTGVGVTADYRAGNSAGTLTTMGDAGMIFTTTAAGSEVSAFRIRNRNAGAVTERFRLWGDGGVTTGSVAATALPDAGLGLPNNQWYWGRAGADWIPIAKVDGGGTINFGTTSLASTILSGAALTISCGASGLDFIFSGTQCAALISATVMRWGSGEASATPGSFTHRSANATGTDIAGSTLTFQGSLGTGTGTRGPVQITGGRVTGAGVGQHTVMTLAQFIDSTVDGTTSFLVQTRKGGVTDVEPVTLIDAASVVGSGRNFLSVA